MNYIDKFKGRYQLILYFIYRGAIPVESTWREGGGRNINYPTITRYSPKRRDRLQSIIQILCRAGSVSLSRARHTSGNRGQEPDGKDERHFVRHFGGRHHRFTNEKTVQQRGSVACYSYARLMINRRSHADKRSLSLCLERFQRRIAIDTTIGSTIMVLDRLDAR